MEFTWFLIAAITVGGATVEERLDAFERPGDCSKAERLVAAEPVEGVEFMCIGELPWTGWDSQPSWMSPEQAEKLRYKN